MLQFPRFGKLLVGSESDAQKEFLPLFHPGSSSSRDTVGTPQQQRWADHGGLVVSDSVRVIYLVLGKRIKTRKSFGIDSVFHLTQG